MLCDLEKSVVALARKPAAVIPLKRSNRVGQRLEFVAAMLCELGSLDSFQGPTLLWRGDSGLIEAMTVNRAIVIGRAPTCDLVFADAGVSRRHAHVAHEQGGQLVRLRDLGSTAGTRLNGRPLSMPVILGDGDVLEVGSVCLAFISGKPVAE